MPLYSSMPVVIIAGGKGIRIGGDKPQRMLAGKTLLDHAIGKAAAFSSHFAIAANRDGVSSLPRDCFFLVDQIDDAGPISGLTSALKHGADHGAEHVMTISCDTPFLPPDLLSKLYDSVGNTNVAVAKSGNRLHPACALWRTEVLGSLSDYLEQNRRSLTGFAEAIGYVEVEWPIERLDPFFNINTTDDLVRAEQIFANMHRQD